MQNYQIKSVKLKKDLCAIEICHILDIMSISSTSKIYLLLPAIYILYAKLTTLSMTFYGRQNESALAIHRSRSFPWSSPLLRAYPHPRLQITYPRPLLTSYFTHFSTLQQLRQRFRLDQRRFRRFLASRQIVADRSGHKLASISLISRQQHYNE